MSAGQAKPTEALSRGDVTNLWIKKQEVVKDPPLTASVDHCEGDGEGLDESVKGVWGWAGQTQDRDLEATVGTTAVFSWWHQSS